MDVLKGVLLPKTNQTSSKRSSNPDRFSCRYVKMYKVLYERYKIGSVKHVDEAIFVKKLIALDTRFLVRCGLEWC